MCPSLILPVFCLSRPSRAWQQPDGAARPGGHDNAFGSRLGRIEGIIEALATRQAGFKTHPAQLLKAQIGSGDEAGKDRQSRRRAWRSTPRSPELQETAARPAGAPRDPHAHLDRHTREREGRTS
jgi:hypothetical protein